MHKKTQGDMGEALVIAQVLEHGCAAFTDFGDNSKIDIIVEDQQGNLHKVQVKCYNREADAPNATKVYAYKSGPNYQFSYHETSIEYFAVVDMATKKIAWVSVESMNGATQLRLAHGERRLKTQNMFDDYLKFPWAE